MDVKFRKQRERFNIVLLEGTRLIRDALLASCKPRTILFSRMSELKSVQDLLPKDNVNLYQVPYNDLQLWSSLKTSPGIMGKNFIYKLSIIYGWKNRNMENTRSIFILLISYCYEKCKDLLMNYILRLFQMFFRNI